jgi:MFS family permease
MAKLDALAKEKAGKFEPRSKKYMVFLIIFMGFVGNMDNFLSLIESYVATDILAYYGLGRAEFAFWQGIFGIISFLVFFVAWFFDAFGRKKGILVLMTLLAVPTLFIGLFPGSFWLFITLYGIVIMATQSNAWQIPITEESPAERRGRNGGITFLIGLIPLYAIFGPSIARAFGWQWAYGAMFFLFLILLIPLYFMKEPERWKHSREIDHGGSFLRIKDAIKLLTRKDVIYVVISSIVYTLWTISFKIGTTWGGVFYRDYLGMSEGSFSTILTIGGLLTMVGAGIGGLLMDKLGRIGTLMIGCIGSAIGFIFLGITTWIPFYWMIYLFMPIILAWIMVYFGEIFPTKVRSTAVGITNTAARSSYVTGPLIASLLFIIFPGWIGFWIVPGLIILIPLLSLLMKPYETRGQELEDIERQR